MLIPTPLLECPPPLHPPSLPSLPSPPPPPPHAPKKNRPQTKSTISVTVESNNWKRDDVKNWEIKKVDGVAVEYSIPSSARWSSFHDESLSMSYIYPNLAPPFYSDSTLTSYLHTLGLTSPGVPDCTITPSKLTSPAWISVTFVQVTRGYTRKHLHSMIPEKIYKSSIWLSHVKNLKDVEVERFIIAVYVPGSMAMKAMRIAAYVNVMLVETVFEVRILLVGGTVEKSIFSYTPDGDQLRRGRVWDDAGRCREAMERGEERGGGEWKEEEGYGFVFEWLFKVV
ncbi:hypothetical protein TrST_g11427 [Triparma strigata]|uniref:Uncharacterized protein n=1 Tax=Triparma strigata TaxID=1606541 RepID=A0A9W7E9R3_9STRA|nr:hypothetical protein TrST_g11427 [Triparma strigata]